MVSALPMILAPPDAGISYRGSGCAIFSTYLVHFPGVVRRVVHVRDMCERFPQEPAMPRLLRQAHPAA